MPPRPYAGPLRGSPIARRSALARDWGVGSATTPLTPSSHELRRAAAVATGDHRFLRGERFRGDEAIVLFKRWKAHHPAPGQMIQQLCIRDPACERDALADAARDGKLLQRRTLFALARDDRPHAGRLGQCQRFDEEIGSFEAGQPRHHEDVVPILVAPIRTLRRRGMENGRTKLRPHREAALNRPRLDEELRHVSRQQISVGGMNAARRARSFTRPAVPSVPLNRSQRS